MTKIKKAFYVFCTTFLGLLISAILISLLERAYIGQVLAENGVFSNQTEIFGFSFYLPLIVVYLIVVLGAAGGAMLGFHWWQYVYVDGFGRSKRKIEKNFSPARSMKSAKKHKVLKVSKPVKKSKTMKATKTVKVIKITKPLKKNTVAKKAKAKKK